MNALTTQAPSAPAPAISSPLSLLMDVQKFEHMCRVGKMLAMSPLFPQHLRGGSVEQGTANAVLVLNMANRLNEDPLSVGQNIYFVGGRPGWNTTYMIAKANQHGVFRDPIDWDIKGKGDTLSVTAFAILSGTGKRVAVTCDMEMAKKEGWTKNAKYQSMPEQMLRYRSAAFLIRLYCPEVMIGVPAQIELEMEARDVTPVDGPAAVQATADAPIEAKAVQQDAATAEANKTASETTEKQRRLDEAAAAEERRRVAEAAEQARKQKEAEAARAESERKAADAARRQQEEQATNRPQTAQAGAPDRERYEHLFEMIMADVNSGADPEEITGLYGPQIEQINAHFPDMGATLAAAMRKG